MASQTSVAVVAEKPSVARDIARVLKCTNQGEGYLHGNGYIVTWAIGHLVTLAQPHEINPKWKAWRRDLLPMLPESWPLVVAEETRDQFEVVRKILNSPKVGEVVCATDAGREGELIFRYIYEAAGCTKPVRRLWISSLTPEAIRAGFEQLKDAAEYDPLADAARGRSRADWLVGMNLSRAYTLSCGEELSVGRVQTPTLAMIVERELAIRAFVPEDYFHVTARFSPGEGQSYEGTWFRRGVEPMDAAMRLAANGVEANGIVARVKMGEARIESIEAQTKRMPPPLLYDLTELQRHANRLYGFTAQRTLELAQSLYERHKVISYPRTDSRYLSQDVAKTLPKIVSAIAGDYESLLAPGTGERPLGRRFVDDSKVSDHHAIIPTGVPRSRVSLSPDEAKILDLICRRLLSAWHDDYIWSVTTVVTVVRNQAEQSEDAFHSTGSTVQQKGWKVLDIDGGKREKRKRSRREEEVDAEPASDDEGQTLPPNLHRGQRQEVLDSEAVSKKTRPPKRFTEATLLTAMETAGKTLNDKELSEAMKENGLGTPATRAQIIEILLRRGFIARRGKSLEATDKGIRLIEIVHPEVKSPAMTGQWEAYLKRIERGQAELGPFLKGIEDYVREVVGKVCSGSRAVAAAPVSSKAGSGDWRRLAGGGVEALPAILHECFGFESFRPNQEEVCRSVTEGCDVLLVMPTGSGKSLCYQLPGIALGGTTLVISPLIALMEDQVAKLAELGFAAERIHSGRDRASSREVCRAYLEGRLDFLFIAPERLRVPNFPEMLARRKPCLIAIDEAHCISQWGHDFRPDYRAIGQHLPALRPAPVIALTATATPLVQRDIAQQLGLNTPRCFIHGFRRDNIAIEVVKVPPSARPDMACQILSADGRRPAIVYAPTRRAADHLAEQLSLEGHAAAAYHAGLDARRRKEVQEGFLEGRFEVIVATIAFGMGIDKPDVRTVIHTALPGSLEGFYQEIGRAGRDGKPSRAILMQSYADRFTHDFFYERDYPEPEVLDRIFEALTPEPQPRDEVQARSRLIGERFDIAMEKLWIHGGVVMDFEENLSRGTEEWRESYIAQRDHKLAQFERMLNYCDTPACRMVTLVKYFGDTADSGNPCGVCDVCNPESTILQRFRPAGPEEQARIAKIMNAVKKINGVSTGRLYSAVLADESQLSRRSFEELLNAMARSGLIELEDTFFEKDGERIDYRRVRLKTPSSEINPAQVQIPVEIDRAPAKPKKDAKRAAKAKTAVRRAKAATKKPKKEAAAAAAAARSGRQAATAEPDGKSASIESALKAWRSAEAKRKGVPAFRILTDRVLQAIAEKQPQSARELLEVPGISLKTVELYGQQIFRIVGG